MTSPRLHATAHEACPACQGDGTVPVNPAWPDPRGEYDVRCDACGGTGLAHGYTDLDHVDVARDERAELLSEFGELPGQVTR